MNLKTREEFQPTEGPWYCLTDIGMYAGGEIVEFGQKIPEYTQLWHVSIHYENGVIGSKKHLESLEGKPIELSNSCKEVPIAKYVSHPIEYQEKVEEIKEQGGETFYIENAQLLKSKKDLVKYAKIFDITLKVATNISMANMLETLEKEAKKLGLIK